MSHNITTTGTKLMGKIGHKTDAKMSRDTLPMLPDVI